MYDHEGESGWMSWLEKEMLKESANGLHDVRERGFLNNALEDRQPVEATLFVTG